MSPTEKPRVIPCFAVTSWKWAPKQKPGSALVLGSPVYLTKRLTPYGAAYTDGELYPYTLSMNTMPVAEPWPPWYPNFFAVIVQVPTGRTIEYAPFASVMVWTGVLRALIWTPSTAIPFVSVTVPTTRPDGCWTR